MNTTEALWAVIAIAYLSILILTAALMGAIIYIASERQRRRDNAVDRDFDARRVQYPEGALDAVLESNLTGGRISPQTVQRLIDRGWLDPR